jgi:hypothetical protein
VYAWYFDELPAAEIEAGGCHHAHALPLLYVGTSPKRPPASGTPSGQNLRKRVRFHYRGNAYGSTLRLTLGCLLGERLGVELRRVGGGKRMTFADGEQTLSAWMAEHAFVCWLATSAPWEVESQLIASLDLPLNLDQNKANVFHSQLTAKRADCKKRARALPVVPG